MSRPTRCGGAPPLWIISAVTFLGLFASSVNMPSIPAMAADLNVSAGVIQGTVTVYLAALALGGLVVGPVSDRFGRRRASLATLIILLAGSVLAVFATSAAMLMFARLVQGIGASGGMVLSRSMVRDAFEGAAASRASAQVAMATAVAPTVAPMIGGYVQHAFGWRGNMLLVAVLAFMLVAVARIKLRETLPSARRHAGGLRSMLAGYPHLIRSRQYMMYTLPIAFGAFGMFAYQTEAPVLLIGILHVPPHEYGILAALPALGFMGGAFASSRLSSNVSSCALIEAGCVLYILSGLGLLAAGWAAPSAALAIALPMMAFGAGNALVMSNAALGGMSAAASLIGGAAALTTSLRMGAGSLGSMVISSVPAGSGIVLGGVVAGSGIAALLSWICLGRGHGHASTPK
jgi:DHA1 family bicyclomycin/chloramphenicol resistance-like MFS transporter